MTRNKKKLLVLLAVVGLCSAVALSYRDKATDKQSAKPVTNKPFSLTVKDPNLTPALAPDFRTGELFYKMIFSILLVIVLGAAAIYVSKKFVPRMTNSANKKVRILETLHLGPHKTVHLLKIGTRKILVGSTNENISSLGDMTDALGEPDFTIAEENR